MRLKYYKYIFFTTIILGLTSCIVSYIEKKKEDKIRQEYVFPEFSFIERDKTDSTALLMSYSEINNKQFASFLRYLKSTGNSMHAECSPDSSLWLSSGFVDLNICDSLYKYYHSHKKFTDFPVVNITKEAALEYVYWLNEIDPNPNYNYNLPTEKQWLTVFSHDDSSIFAWPGSYWRNMSDKKMANFAEYDQNYIRYNHRSDDVEFIRNIDSALSFFVEGPFKVFSNYPNALGMYNICGNVAEMILDKNYTKGGSWHSPIHYLKRHSIEYYDLPSPYVGFRVVKIETRNANKK